MDGSTFCTSELYRQVFPWLKFRVYSVGFKGGEGIVDGNTFCTSGLYWQVCQWLSVSGLERRV